MGSLRAGDPLHSWMTSRQRRGPPCRAHATCSRAGRPHVSSGRESGATRPAPRASGRRPPRWRAPSMSRAQPISPGWSSTSSWPRLTALRPGRHLPSRAQCCSVRSFALPSTSPPRGHTTDGSPPQLAARGARAARDAKVRTAVAARAARAAKVGTTISAMARRRKWMVGATSATRSCSLAL